MLKRHVHVQFNLDVGNRCLLAFGPLLGHMCLQVAIWDLLRGNMSCSGHASRVCVFYVGEKESERKREANVRRGRRNSAVRTDALCQTLAEHRFGSEA